MFKFIILISLLISVNSHAQLTNNGLTNAQLRASPVPVSGTLSISTSGLATDAWQVSQTTVLNNILTQATSIENNTSSFYALTDSQLRAANVSTSSYITAVSGTVASVRQVGTSSQVVSGDNGIVTNSVIHGLSSAGGGTFVDVKVNPSGSLETSGTFTVNGIPTVSGTTRLTAGTAAIGSITNTSFGATQVGQWLSPSGTTTTSGTQQLTAGSAVIGAVTQSGSWSQSILNSIGIASGSVSVLNSLGIASGTLTGITNTVTTSGTTQLTAGSAIIGSVNQGTNPWTVSGSVSLNGVQPVSATIGNTVNVNTHAVTGSGTFTTSGTVQLTAGTSFIGTVSAGQVTVLQGTTPWVVSAGQMTVTNTGFNSTVLNSLGIASGTVNATVLNSLGIASGTLTGITNTVNVSSVGTVQYLETRPSAATQAKLTSSVTSATCLSSNANRRGATFFNASSGNMYIMFGATASATSMTYYAVPSATVEVHYPAYTGVVSCIWDSAQGFGYVTEY